MPHSLTMCQELCGCTGGSDTAGDLDSYNHGAETVPELLYAVGATGKTRVRFESSKKLLSEAHSLIIHY